jgi:chorismate dehydratase
VDTKKVHISIVNYTNTLPFKWALKNSSLLASIDLQEDIPSICAQKLKYDQVDLALVPVALLPELSHYYLVSDYCIGAKGKVDSVKLYSAVPLHDISTVVLDYQSKSSITLTKVLTKFFWKANFSFEDAVPGFENQVAGTRAAVVIGDRTFKLNGKYAYEYDLAEEWQKFTGLPFVFAAWVSTKILPESFVKEFNAVLRQGIEHIDSAIAAQLDASIIGPAEAAFYLKERINYPLGADKREALALFLNYIKKL